MQKICKHCGEPFITNNPQKMYCNRQHYRPCPICGKPVAMIDNDFSRAPKCCSSTCSHELRKRKIKKRKCIFCGKEFQPKSGVALVCDDKHFRKCEICGKEFELTIHNYKDVTTCSQECTNEKLRRRSQERYGTDHPMQNEEVQQHHRDAMKEKYGVESPLQSPEIKAKVNATMQERYGVDWALSSKEVHAKAKATMIERYGAPNTYQSHTLFERITETLQERYGVDNPMKNSDIKEQAHQTCIERYGVDNPMKAPEIQLKALTAIRKDSPDYNELKKYWNTGHGIPYEVIRKLPEHSIGSISKINKKLALELYEHGIDIELEFPLGGKLYDFYIPSQHVLVEVDPSYTHSTAPNHWSEGLRKSYHLEKSQVANNYGYRCIHVFEWDNMHTIIANLQPKQKVHARNCKVVDVSLNDAQKFLSQYHLQGTCRGQFILVGLMYQDELIEIMTFGKSRYNKNYDWELLRLCTLPQYQVVGGASKLFKYAITKYQLNNIISYCDLAKFTGKVYENIGMKKVRITPPQEVWSKGSEKVTANLLRQRGFDQLFGTNFGKGTSNEQLMLDNGWLPVYDCGQAVYEYV